MDLSDFNYQSHHFKEFVTSLDTFDEKDLGKRWCFEETLLYLNLPYFADSQVDVIVRLLEWLTRKGVNNILYLKLPDCTAEYNAKAFVCSEVFKRFRIAHLDWICLDADIQEIACWCSKRQPPIDSLTALDIYSHKDFNGLIDAKHVQDPDTAREAFEWFHDVRHSQTELLSTHK